jgi:dTDP-4-dehydrorhamnose reductase
MNESELLILGSRGQLGLALRTKYPSANAVDSDGLDITDRTAVEAFNWSGITTIINAAAYTNVDGAESPEGRVAAWSVNADGVANLVAAAAQHDATLVHISSDYVFDGTQENHSEDEAFSPLSVYGSTKAAGDLALSLTPKFYLLRSSWVIGDGKNFVRSIMGLATKDISPNVVADQFGRLTFTSELVRAIDHLLTTRAAYGTYNVSNDGDVVSWADLARQIYEYMERSDLTVGDTTAEEYFAGKLSASRPTNSDLDLSRIKASGFMPHDWRSDLKDYITKEQAA